MNCEICDSKLIKLKIFKKKLHKENLFGLETNKNYKRILLNVLVAIIIQIFINLIIF